VIDLLGRNVEPLILAEAERRQPFGRDVTGREAGRQMAQLVQKRHHLVEVAVGDDGFLGVGTGLLGVGRD
jgi:hypothetical protein